MKQKIAGLILALMPLGIAANPSSQQIWTSSQWHGDYKDYHYIVAPEIRFVGIGDTPPANQFLFNAGIGKDYASHWSVWGGLIWSNTAQDTFGNNLQELRIWQQLNRRFKTTSLSRLAARTRIEERTASGQAQWSIRLRQQLEWCHTLPKKMALIAGEELFVNLKLAPWVNTGTMDQNRLYMGLRQDASPTLQIFAGYMYQSVFATLTRQSHIVLIGTRIKENPFSAKKPPEQLI